jgi:hypothetical protein
MLIFQGVAPDAPKAESEGLQPCGKFGGENGILTEVYTVFILPNRTIDEQNNGEPENAEFKLQPQ